MKYLVRSQHYFGIGELELEDSAAARDFLLASERGVAFHLVPVLHPSEEHTVICFQVEPKIDNKSSIDGHPPTFDYGCTDCQVMFGPVLGMPCHECHMYHVNHPDIKDQFLEIANVIAKEYSEAIHDRTPQASKVLDLQCRICQGMHFDPAFANARNSVSPGAYPCHRCHTFHADVVLCRKEDIRHDQLRRASQIDVYPGPEHG